MSWHLARVSNTSLTDTEPAMQRILTGLLKAGMLESSQRLLIHFVTPLWHCLQGNCSKMALRACSSSGLEKVSSLRLVFLLYVQVHSKILPSRNRLKQRPHQAATRAARPSTDCVRHRIQFSNLLKPCTSMGIEANAAKWTSNWASLLVISGH